MDVTITECLVQKIQSLDLEDQQKVLQFIESLEKPTPGTQARRDPCGMLAHLGVSISLEDIQEARHGAWVNFPRPFPDEEKS